MIFEQFSVIPLLKILFQMTAPLYRILVLPIFLMVQGNVKMIRLSTFIRMDISICNKHALKYSYNICSKNLMHHLGNHKYIQIIDFYDIQWPLLLTWFNFNPSMDK